MGSGQSGQSKEDSSTKRRGRVEVKYISPGDDDDATFKSMQSVERNNANAVRKVHKRLLELGVVSVSEYVRIKRDVFGIPNVAAAAADGKGNSKSIGKSAHFFSTKLHHGSAVEQEFIFYDDAEDFILKDLMRAWQRDVRYKPDVRLLLSQRADRGLSVLIAWVRAQ
jgi:hypothetical protein